MIKLKLAALLFFLVTISGCGRSNQTSSTGIEEPLSTQTSSIQSTETNAVDAKSEPSTKDIIIYSGKCTKYERNLFEETKVSYTPKGDGFAKVVLNSSSKKFTFFFDNELIFSENNYLSYIDDQQGGEGFTFSAGLSAHLFTAERAFKIYQGAEPSGSEDPFMGYEYDITDYVIN